MPQYLPLEAEALIQQTGIFLQLVRLKHSRVVLLPKKLEGISCKSIAAMAFADGLTP
jgi:hypothetical protein